MKTKPCEQSWQIEALRDGRMGDASRVRVEAHIAGCAACQETSEALAHLATDVASAGDGLDDLALRRLRSRVLRDADARLHSATTASHYGVRRPWRVAGVVAAFAACLIAALWLRPDAPAPGRTAPAAPLRTAGVEPSAGTVWSRNVGDGLDRIVLVQGAIHVRVEHGREDARVRVVTPDATIDDVGTIFTVEVRDGHTQSVRVDEGRVAITFTDGVHVALRAGEEWRSSRVEVVAGNLPAAQPISHDEGPPATQRGQGTWRPRAPGGAQTPATDEDADYLAVVAAEQAGNAVEAERAARRYLERHPDGFRRREIEVLLAR